MADEQVSGAAAAPGGFGAVGASASGGAGVSAGGVGAAGMSASGVGGAGVGGFGFGASAADGAGGAASSAGVGAAGVGGAGGSGAAGDGAAVGQRHVYLCAMRWSDMDSYGHVNNMIYLQYLEQARVDWMVSTANRAGVFEFELGTVVARHTIEYKRPLVYRPEPVRVETWVTEIGHGSFTVAYEVKDDDYVYATAESMLVPFDLRENRLRRLTPTERGYLEQYLIKKPQRAGLPPGAGRFGLGVSATER